jgi:predicted nucleic acid-binding protein
MPDRQPFLDSNILCYLFGSEPEKAARARALLVEEPTVSVQVLAEICNVARRKNRLSWSEIEEIIETVSDVCAVVPLTIDLQRQARAIAAATGYTIYDAQVLAAAAVAGCDIVWSEDMQDGHDLSALGVPLVIRNPFGDEPA